jgi:hypothetical protein
LIDIIADAFRVNIDEASEKVGLADTDHEPSVLKLSLIELLVQEKTFPETMSTPKPLHSSQTRSKVKENENPDDIDDKLKAINDIANQRELTSLSQFYS